MKRTIKTFGAGACLLAGAFGALVLNPHTAGAHAPANVHLAKAVSIRGAHVSAAVSSRLRVFHRALQSSAGNTSVRASVHAGRSYGMRTYHTSAMTNTLARTGSGTSYLRYRSGTYAMRAGASGSTHTCPHMTSQRTPGK